MKDSDGNECDLATLCVREPGWAANRIQALTAERDQLLREWEDGIANELDCMEESVTGEPLRKPHKQIMAEAKARDVAAADARGYARCQADVVAWLRGVLAAMERNDDTRQGVICDLLPELEAGEHVGALKGAGK